MISRLATAALAALLLLHLLRHSDAPAGPRPRLRRRPGDHAPMLADPAHGAGSSPATRARPRSTARCRGWRAPPPSSRRSTGSPPEVFADLTRNSNGDPRATERGARSGQVRPGRLRGHAPSGDTGAAPRAVHQDLRHPAMTHGNRTISLLKGRMAEALVEAVFKRAKYTVARVGRETQMPALVRTGRVHAGLHGVAGPRWAEPRPSLLPPGRHRGEVPRRTWMTTCVATRPRGRPRWPSSGPSSTRSS